MSDSITDRIAAIITEHRFGVRQWRDGYRHSSCMCIEEIGANEHSAHVAEVIVEQLGLAQETRTNVMSSAGMTTDTRTGVMTTHSDIRYDRRYVTKWEAG